MTSPTPPPPSTAAQAPTESPETKPKDSAPTDPYTPDAQGWSAPLYTHTAPFVFSPASTAPVLALLRPQPGERILDLGCGSGEVSLVVDHIVRGAGAGGEGGYVVGVDYSESMIATAKTAGLQHAFVADIQAPLVLPGFTDVKFDTVFSNAALHWCKRDPAGVLASAKSMLKAGGRLVVEMGGAMNCIGIRSALHQALRARGYDPIALDPWFFPSVEEYTALLTTASFHPLSITLTPRPTPLPSGLLAWLTLFARPSILRPCPDAEAAEIMAEVVEACRVDCQDALGRWGMVYMRLRFEAVLV
ncbi:S-adenosyl-L-methionine-dependent methyltransferase [Mycena filopes]|nr:S-adenosyl-L-methionine-dependent methyltransferase [Mycena filopes]